MKKLIPVVLISALVLSFNGVASASAQENPGQLTVTLTNSIVKNPSSPSREIVLMDQNITIIEIGSKIKLTSGDWWKIAKGSNVVTVNEVGEVTAINYGYATIHAYKNNGHLLGTYYITVAMED